MSQYMSVTVHFRGDTFEIEGDYTPIRRGFISGPPEKCYPDEGGEFEIAVIKFENTDITLVAEHCFDEGVMAEIRSLCEEKAESEYREAVAESRAEYRQDRRESDRY